MVEFDLDQEEEDRLLSEVMQIHNDIQMEDIKTSGYYTACVSFQGQDNNFYSQGVWNNNKVLNSELTGAYYGARLYGGGNNNTLGNCNINSPYYYGVYDYYSRGTKLLYNRISDLNYATYSYGIMSYYGIGDTLMGNIIKGAGRYGIYSYQANNNSHSDHTVIANNMISNFQSTSYQTGIYMYYFNYNVHVTNNTIWMTGSSNAYYNAAIYAYYYPYYCEIINNILISTNKTRLVSFYYGYNLARCDYNDYYHTGTATYYFYNRGDYTWNTFKNNTNYIGVHDQNSYYLIDPEIISPDNMHLLEGSGGLVGVSTWNPVDVDGDPRCQLVRFLGADEPAWKVVKSDFVYDHPEYYVGPDSHPSARHLGRFFGPTRDRKSVV